MSIDFYLLINFVVIIRYITPNFSNFMYLGNFSLNFVTAMIGAISIGIGIDYSIHMTERFRQELLLTNNKIEAVRNATHGAGTALVASAASSIPSPSFSRSA